MNLREFLKKYKITQAELSKHTNISAATIWNCLHNNKRHVPSQRAALVIEEYTKGLVTVKEIRGKDDRVPFNPDNT